MDSRGTPEAFRKAREAERHKAEAGVLDEWDLCDSRDGLLLADINHVVIDDSIDEFVVWIDSRSCRLFVYNDLERVVRLSHLFFLHIEWLLFILLALEHPDLNVVVQLHRGLVAIPVRSDLTSLHRERDFVLLIRGWRHRRGDRFVVI